ncbi:iron ABC transporter permease [Micromonospora sp. HM5-17]|uniref:FecCD family ABC transporter permease n=1 Tax=Micromonospora sp. HM5-17 TaxID=2487710 RepID=UPI000F47BCC5|nr:iron ABC transporter permease [Micromonospora sp. HM5-17]ROT33908.1 iron ABC transporter permease [Micromonospora sp. HM5-17]
MAETPVSSGAPAPSGRGARRARDVRDPFPARPAGLRRRWLVAGIVAVAVAAVAGIAYGPVSLPPGSVAAELLNLVPGVHLQSGLNEREIAIVTDLRLPRVVLGLLVGGTLALAGGCYQGVFRNPLADPHLLGVAAGAGLAVTAVIVMRGVTGADITVGLPVTVPLAAFVGALGAVLLTYLLGAAGGRDRSPATLILAGVAVSAFLSAGQTYLLQNNAESIQEVYSWMLGRLTTAGWHDVLIVLPYAVVTAGVLLLHRRELDVLTIGDDEASSLGLHPQRSRLLLVAAASLGTAAAVSVSGLIGFVGIIVPHTVRMLAGASYRAILPLSVLFGGAFLALTDLIARTVAAPAEIPIGVVTAILGGPFFALVLRTTKRVET